jgi:hypothetical protein
VAWELLQKNTLRAGEGDMTAVRVPVLSADGVLLQMVAARRAPSPRTRSISRKRRNTGRTRKAAYVRVWRGREVLVALRLPIPQAR